MKSCLISLLLFCLVANAKTYVKCVDYCEPPLGDELLTNRLGRSWSDPIYNGYLVIDDHYVDAPYVVEQRGFAIFVNNERVEDGTDIRFVLPFEHKPVTSDPGLPDNVTRTTRIAYALIEPVSIANQWYWDYLGLTGQARVNANIAYLRRLPCVSNVVDFGPGYNNTRELRIHDYIGTEEIFMTPLQPHVPFVSDDRAQYPQVLRRNGDFYAGLANNRYLCVINAGLRSDGQGPSPDEYPKWYASFRTLESPYLNSTQRLERLRQLRMIGPTDDLIYCDGVFPMNGFHTSTQLWQRLSGDMSWTNDAPARMFALTNGWQKILPAFMRTQTVAVATMASTSPDKTRTIDTQQPKKHGKPVHKGSSQTTSTQESDTMNMNSRSITFWSVTCLGLVFLGLFVFYRSKMNAGK